MEVFSLLSHTWDYCFRTMINFSEVYPVPALFIFLGLSIAMIYRSIQSFRSPRLKPKHKIFNIKARVENPVWYVQALEFVIGRTLQLPFYMVYGLVIGGMKVYFYFLMKKIETKV